MGHIIPHCKITDSEGRVVSFNSPTACQLLMRTEGGRVDSLTMSLHIRNSN
jgi:hypothetical protein